MANLRVAIIAPPWLGMPVQGYGGIEKVLEGLIYSLGKLDVDVEIFGNGERTMPGFKTHSLYSHDQFEHIHKPYYYSLPILLAHMQFALNMIEEDGGFDIIHDHSTFIGPEILSLFTRIDKMPPALYTIHGPPYSTQDLIDQGYPDNRLMFRQLKNTGNLHFVAISESFKATIPEEISDSMLPTVYNAIELRLFPFTPVKKDHFITLARFSPDKGQHIAAKAAVELGLDLVMAGPVSNIGGYSELLSVLEDDNSINSQDADLSYYRNEIHPYVMNHLNISNLGNIGGSKKIRFIAEAKALLFPIQYEEPFGMSVIEALACGTPVVAMNRGAMPEIIEHGVNGFLANNESDFYEYVKRIDEIDPVACRRSVEEKFTSEIMAKAYLDRYREVIKLSKKNKS